MLDITTPKHTTLEVFRLKRHYAKIPLFRSFELGWKPPIKLLTHPEVQIFIKRFSIQTAVCFLCFAGSRLSAVLKMIQHWKVKDSDLFCHDKCAGRCAHCSQQQQAHFRHPKLCGILTKADGPFSACHKNVDPTIYLDNCVYDVCVNKGKPVIEDVHNSVAFFHYMEFNL